MKKKQIGHIFSALTKALMTMTTCGSVYLLRTVVRMIEHPAAALQLYHSFPELSEHIAAGVLFYVIFGLLLTKLISSDKNPV